MKIRSYRAADHDSVWELHNIALHQVGAHAANGRWDDDLHRVESEYLAIGGEFYVGVKCDRIVAMGALSPVGEGRAEIKRMRVHPNFQRRGLGTAMLSALERRAVELGFVRLVLETTAQQTAARNLYTTSGYAEIGKRTEGHFEVILFEKEIAT